MPFFGLRPQCSGRQPAEKKRLHAKVRSRRGFLALATSIYPHLRGLFQPEIRRSFYPSHKQIFFFLLFFNNLSVFRALGGWERDYCEISRIAAVGAILTVKMPTDPIIIIVGGGLI
jgi:hypothetical protein